MDEFFCYREMCDQPKPGPFLDDGWLKREDLGMWLETTTICMATMNAVTIKVVY